MVGSLFWTCTFESLRNFWKVKNYVFRSTRGSAYCYQVMSNFPGVLSCVPPVAREATPFPNLLIFIPTRVCPYFVSVCCISIICSSRSVDIVYYQTSSLVLNNSWAHLCLRLEPRHLIVWTCCPGPETNTYIYIIIFLKWVWCGGVGVPGLALFIVLGIGAAGIVIDCWSTLIGGWVILYLCYTILVCV